MSAIDYPHFERVLTRCAETAGEKNMKPNVVLTYEEVLKDAANVFLAAHAQVTEAETAYAKENKEALVALRAMDAPYREARSVAVAFVPSLVLPDTLKVQPTDTDKVNAIEHLLDAIEKHAGEKWADQLIASEFGQLAGPTVKEINEGIDANKAVSAAREARAKAYGPAYERYLRFKRVVRDALGATSKQYKRIHVRRSTPDEADGSPEATTTPQATAPQPSTTAPAPTTTTASPQTPAPPQPPTS